MWPSSMYLWSTEDLFAKRGGVRMLPGSRAGAGLRSTSPLRESVQKPKSREGGGGGKRPKSREGDGARRPKLREMTQSHLAVGDEASHAAVHRE